MDVKLSKKRDIAENILAYSIESILTSSHILLSLSSKRERISSEIVMYGLYLYFLGLSFCNVSRAREPFVQSLMFLSERYKSSILNRSIHVKEEYLHF